MAALCGGTQGIGEEPMLRLGLERSSEAPALARAAVAGFFEEREISPPALATLTLLVSELVSNAVLHSDASSANGIMLCAYLSGDGTVRVEVTDQGSGFTPAPRDPDRHSGGYGLYIVGQQATRWGVDRRDGVRVWFEMSSGGAD